MELDPTHEQVSYLRARDPSIISYNRSKFNKIRCNLMPLMNETNENLHNPPADAFMKIYLRLKGDVPVSPLYKVDGSVLSCTVSVSQMKKHLKEGDVLHKNYSFSKIFDDNALQTEIFNTIVKPKMFDLINGHNSTFLTYGASGSGKTYTIVGTESNPGVIPRALEYLFGSLPKLNDLPKEHALEGGRIQNLPYNEQIHARDIRDNLIDYFDKVSGAQIHKETYKKMQQRLSEEQPATVDYEVSDVSVSVWISFAEIYNEYIFDLLQPHTKNRPKLTLRVCKNGDPYIKGLTSVFVSTGLESYQILKYGLTNLNYAATALNDHSSRSHCIFTIKLVQSCAENSEGCISSFNFCDLAGSERLKKTNNVGDRLRESNNINNSLMVLGRCLKDVRDAQKRKNSRTIPFRDSKLTMLFQNAISGRENLSMIVNVNPSEYMYPETQHVLNFSAIAMEVKIVHIPKVKSNSRAEDQIAHERIMELEELLEQMQEQVDSLEAKGHLDLTHVMDLLRQRSEELNQQWNERMERLRLAHEDEVEELYARISQLTNGQKNNTVIEITDSDEESDTEINIHVDYLAEINCLKLQNTQLEAKLHEKDKQLRATEQRLDDTVANLHQQKRTSTKHLERVIELEHELELNETYDRSMRSGDSEEEWESDISCTCGDVSNNCTVELKACVSENDETITKSEDKRVF